MLVAIMLTLGNAQAQPIHKVEIEMNPSLQEHGERAYSQAPLTWEDFQGRPDHGSPFIAMTYSGIKLRYSYATRRGETTARIEICPYMDLRQSWYKKHDCNDTTLVHEQRHFDITALVTREFVDEIRNRQFELSTFSSEIKKLHRHYLQKLARMQEEYDGDTVHGTIPEKQAVWVQRIAEAVRTFSGG